LNLSCPAQAPQLALGQWLRLVCGLRLPPPTPTSADDAARARASATRAAAKVVEAQRMEAWRRRNAALAPSPDRAAEAAAAAEAEKKGKSGHGARVHYSLNPLAPALRPVQKQLFLFCRLARCVDNALDGHLDPIFTSSLAVFFGLSSALAFAYSELCHDAVVLVLGNVLAVLARVLGVAALGPQNYFLERYFDASTRLSALALSGFSSEYRAAFRVQRTWRRKLAAREEAAAEAKRAAKAAAAEKKRRARASKMQRQASELRVSLAVKERAQDAQLVAEFKEALREGAPGHKHHKSGLGFGGKSLRAITATADGFRVAHTQVPWHMPYHFVRGSKPAPKHVRFAQVRAVEPLDPSKPSRITYWHEKPRDAAAAPALKKTTIHLAKDRHAEAFHEGLKAVVRLNMAPEDAAGADDDDKEDESLAKTERASASGFNPLIHTVVVEPVVVPYPALGGFCVATALERDAWMEPHRSAIVDPPAGVR